MKRKLLIPLLTTFLIVLGSEYLAPEKGFLSERAWAAQKKKAPQKTKKKRVKKGKKKTKKSRSKTSPPRTTQKSGSTISPTSKAPLELKIDDQLKDKYPTNFKFEVLKKVPYKPGQVRIFFHSSDPKTTLNSSEPVIIQIFSEDLEVTPDLITSWPQNQTEALLLMKGYKKGTGHRIWGQASYTVCNHSRKKSKSKQKQKQKPCQPVLTEFETYLNF